MKNKKKTTMINISNEKLVLWGHILVLGIILLVGFGMMFNVVEIDRKTHSIKNDEAKENIIPIVEIVNLTIKEIALNECNTEIYSLDNECIQVATISEIQKKDDISLCYNLDNILVQESCITTFLDSKFSLNLDSKYCYELAENDIPLCEEIYLQYLESSNTFEYGDSLNCEKNDLICIDEELFEESLLEIEIFECSLFYQEEMKNDCSITQRYLKTFYSEEIIYFCSELETNLFIEYCKESFTKEIIY
jgi:hypothetical protein